MPPRRPRILQLLAAAAALPALARLAAAAGPSNSSKTAAVEKVISLLEDLQTQVLQEGEKEATTYNKFACFCKDTTKEKSEAVTGGEDAHSSLTATIGELATRRDELDGQVSDLVDEIAKTEQEMKEAGEQRMKELREYQQNEADLAAALQALKGAIQVLKASKSPTLAQLQAVAKTVRLATIVADALGIGGKPAQRAAAFLLQEGEVPTENYKFHAESIIATLETLLADFKAEKGTVDAAEVSAIAAHDTFIQEKTNYVSTKNNELAAAKKEKAEKQEAIATNSQDLSTVAATLLDDKQYLSGLATMCSSKAKTWDQRSQVRTDELSALTSAIGIVKSTVQEKTTAATIRFAQSGVTVRLAQAMVRSADDMEAVEAEAEAADAGAAPSFLQRRGRSLRRRPQDADSATAAADGRQVVINLLRSRGQQLRSATLASLASELAADPLAKVKTLIQELIERLLQQASSEATQRGWCATSIAAAEQKRDYAAQAVEELNGGMAQLEALRDKLKQELQVLTGEIEGLDKKQLDADQLRADEKVENAATVTEAKAGQDAVAQAIDILTKFYKTAEKGTVDLSFSQRAPVDDAPEAGFADGEAYKGASGPASGVLGMLEVIRSDFVRTAEQTEEAERLAEQEHLVFTTETQKSLAEKNTATTEKTRQKDDSEDKLSSDEESLGSETALLQAAIKELLQLKGACLDTGMSYQDRVARRDEEIAALKKADCILSSYAQYGPDSATTADC